MVLRAKTRRYAATLFFIFKISVIENYTKPKLALSVIRHPFVMNLLDFFQMYVLSQINHNRLFRINLLFAKGPKLHDGCQTWPLIAITIISQVTFMTNLKRLWLTESSRGLHNPRPILVTHELFSMTISLVCKLTVGVVHHIGGMCRCWRSRICTRLKCIVCGSNYDHTRHYHVYLPGNWLLCNYDLLPIYINPEYMFA